MKFEILTEEEFKIFSDNHGQKSFLQDTDWAKLRKRYNTKILYLGIKDEKNKILAASMFLEEKTYFSMKRLYAPRGFLIDYHNEELLKIFTDNLKKYAKKNKIMFIKLDPNVIYQVRDINGNEYENPKKDDETINNLKKLGYKHTGFDLDTGDYQSRWNFRLELNKPYEELKNNFSKSTRKNIESTYEKGMRVRTAKFEDLESMEDILIKTAERKKFQYKSLEYYKNMYECLGDKLKIYIAYLDANIYVESTGKLIEKEQENNKIILEKMQKDMIGNKLKNQLETSNKLLSKYEEELNEAKKFKKENPNGKDIGTLVSIKSGDEFLTLYSGILMEYKRFTPKYLMYNEHIKDAYEMQFKYVDFYGITGHFNKDNKDYGMYEFKRGFGGEVIEMVGEFNLPTSFLYYIYKFFKNLKK